MNIISSTNVSRPGNDGYIEESYSLVEQFGLYAVIRFYRPSGFDSHGDVFMLLATTDQSAARAKYKECCMAATKK